MVHAQEDYDDEDAVGGERDVCALCCTKPNLGLSMCGKCQLIFCTSCIGMHTCDKVTIA